MSGITLLNWTLFAVPLFTVVNGVVYMCKKSDKLGFMVSYRGSVRLNRGMIVRVGIKVRFGVRFSAVVGEYGADRSR